MATKTEEIDLDELMRSKRESLTAKRDEIKAELEKVEDQLQRIEAYLNPQAVPTVQRTAPVQASTPRASRISRSGVREAVLAAIRENASAGLTSKQIEEHLTAQGMEAKSLPNLLSLLKKDGLISQSAKRMPFFPSVPGQGTAPSDASEEAA